VKGGAAVPRCSSAAERAAVPRCCGAVLTAGLLTVACLVTFGTALGHARGQDVRALAPAIERNLRKSVIAFWYPRVIDREHGGYLIDFDATGQFKGQAPKMIVTQARMLWLSARLMREGRADDVVREAARVGYRFLMDRMWDREHGGFNWEVDRTGTTVVAPHKHLYGQAFGLYALSEYAMASGDAHVLADAERLFTLLDERAHDRDFGGYREFFASDWGPAPAGITPYLGATADVKLMNTHLHLMEAVATFYRASHSPLAAARLAELITIQSNAVVRKTVGACTDQYQRDWTPRLTTETSRASYGHDLENIWLLVDAHEALGLPVAPLSDLFKTLFAYALAHGYDREHGGFYDSGPLGADADRRSKTWWVEAEALVSALTMFRLTGDPSYAKVFAQTWQFVDEKQTDAQNGEWYETVTPDGVGVGDKAHRWKAGYHNGRALLECLRLLKAIQ
jgi:mannose/cellobiose epimerase-like protein (N-acyl-D-glucosamine 2-epimerase family)